MTNFAFPRNAETMWLVMALVAIMVRPAEAAAVCTLCEEGSPVSLPDKVIDFIPGIPNLNCGELDDLVPAVQPVDSDACALTHRLSTICGCKRREDACLLCRDGADVSTEYTSVPVDHPSFTAIFSPGGSFAPSCELLEGYLHSFSIRDDFCVYTQSVAGELCGCAQLDSFNDTNVSGFPGNNNTAQPGDVPVLDWEDFELSVYGVKSPRDRHLQQSISRASAILSILASLLVIQDNLRDAKRRKNLYNQIITLMAGFDIISSIAYSLLDIPRPADDVLFGEGEQGNSASCTAQGWFIQWGQSTSLFFNAALSTYYLLVIVYCCTETKLQKLRKYLLGVPLVIGLVFALASIPFISYGATGCFVVHPSFSATLEFLGIIDFAVTWGPILGLVVVPIFVVLFYATLSMIRVYWYVRQTDAKASKWNIRTRAADGVSNEPAGPSGSREAVLRRIKCKRSYLSASFRGRARKSATSTLRREVAWQCLWYLFALYITWGLYATVNATMHGFYTSHFQFWNVYFFLLPLQGFMNACVYFRPRLARRWSAFLEDRKTKRASAVAARQDRGDGGTEAGSSGSNKLFSWRTWRHRTGQGSGTSGDDPYDVEPVSALVFMNTQQAKDSHGTLDSATDLNPTTNREVDVEQHNVDDELVLGESPEKDLDEDLRGLETDKEAASTLQFSESYIVTNKEEGTTTENQAYEESEIAKKKRSDQRRRRSSLQMLASALVGIDTVGLSKFGASCSDSESSEFEAGRDVYASQQLHATRDAEELKTSEDVDAAHTGQVSENIVANEETVASTED